MACHQKLGLRVGSKLQSQVEHAKRVGSKLQSQVEHAKRVKSTVWSNNAVCMHAASSQQGEFLIFFTTAGCQASCGLGFTLHYLYQSDSLASSAGCRYSILPMQRSGCRDICRWFSDAEWTLGCWFNLV